MIRAEWLAAVLFSLPALAASREERVSRADFLVRQALQANDERDSDCQLELERKLERVLGELQNAVQSEDALGRALRRARSVREVAEDDCPGRITRSVLPPLEEAIRVMERTIESPGDDDGEAPPQEEVVAPVESPPPVIAVEIEPPMVEPPPIEVPPPQPDIDWFWVGGFWTWQGQWVWVHGRWREPPQVGYFWCQPYYENRGGAVVFVSGHWRPPGSVFVPPSPNAVIVRVQPRPGVVMGPPPMGPSGVFIPAPPGSRPGIIIPAPVGTAPAVVTSAPPVIKPGMRIEGRLTPGANLNQANVRVVAPAGVTASGRPVTTTVPAAAHLAAARAPVVRATAPTPASAHPLPAFNPRQAPPALPRPQPVQVAPAPARPATPVAPLRPAPEPTLRPPPSQPEPARPEPTRRELPRPQPTSREPSQPEPRPAPNMRGAPPPPRPAPTPAHPPAKKQEPTTNQ
jgi:hypothetical protein